MHIKKIVIQGFKTYKNTTVIDDLSPGHNVVVGRNGSGKSNFFAAIRFVLSDQYYKMSKEERQGLIHEGSGSVLSAYVEIVFDNSDGRFPTGKDEVVIRRTIGLKKDDYSLDYKSSTRVDVMQLLESAGFSKSNPYYIVPQGRITSLTNAKDSERLNLLKEVAGAKVFENKLRDSQKEMDKTKNQREKIDEMLVFIEDRLSDLDAEKDELKNFQDLERGKKIYEFKLYDHELNEITNAIEDIDSEYQNALENSSKFWDNLQKGETTAAELTKSIDALESELKILKIDKAQSSATVEEITKALYAKKSQLVELSEQLNARLENDKKYEKTLAKLEKQKTKNEELLSQKKPIVEELRTQESSLKQRLATLKTKQNILYSKQGRYSKFDTKQKRDEWIKAQINDLINQRAAKQKQIEEHQTNLEAYKQDLVKLTQESDALNDQITGQAAQKERNSYEDQINELKAQMTMINDEKKHVWREMSRTESILSTLKDDLSKADREVNRTMDRHVSRGLQAVNQIANKLGLTGVYGTLGELIQVSPKYRTAVEVIAGNQLFHVVVDNDTTATAIMDELIREKAGRVTFMPLNRLNPKNHTYPDTSNCVPLIKKMLFTEEIAPAVKQVFGKTVVAVDLKVGYELARNYNLNAITLDGDKAEKKGVLTGGFRDNKRSRLQAMSYRQEKEKDVRNKEAELLFLQHQSDQKQQQLNKLNNDLNEIHAKYDRYISEKKDLKNTHSAILNQKFRVQQNIELLEDQIRDCQSAIATIITKIEEHQKELQSSFQEGLSADEKQELNTLTKTLVELENELNTTTDNLLNEESDLSRLEIELHEIILPRLNQIKKSAKSTDVSELDAQYVNVSEEVEKLSEQRDEAEALSDQEHQKSAQKTKELKKLRDDLEKTNESQRKMLRSLENFQKNSERSLSKKQVLIKRKKETQAKIRQLGTLPDAAFDESHDYTRDILLKKLNEVTEGLEKFSHVNRKALEQYMNFTKQRDSLVERRRELDKSEESIVDLMKHLSERKNDAIDKTFQEVSTAFSEVFEKLVPKGTGRLIMQEKGVATQQEIVLDEGSDAEGDEGTDGIDNYSGVSIQVSFNSKSDEQQRIEQLSGGQKSLCAIAFILAIQKSDPAPFYLFDEIDANLDTQYRTAVANMIHELSENAQFICTTFRPEMLQVANKFFGVSFNNKISSVSEIDQAMALGFVEGEQQQH